MFSRVYQSCTRSGFKLPMSCTKTKVPEGPLVQYLQHFFRTFFAKCWAVRPPPYAALGAGFPTVYQWGDSYVGNLNCAVFEVFNAGHKIYRKF